MYAPCRYIEHFGNLSFDFGFDNRPSYCDPAAWLASKLAWFQEVNLLGCQYVHRSRLGQLVDAVKAHVAKLVAC